MMMVLKWILSVNIFLFQCPLTWQSKWEGPEDPLQYLRSLVARALAIQVILKSHFTSAHWCSVTWYIM